MKKILTLIIILSLIITACGNSNDKNSDAVEEAYTAVEVETIAPMELYIENIITAKAYADKDVFVIPMLSGKVEKIKVKVGDRVGKDDILFIMNKEDIDKQVNQAYAAYESAKAGYDLNVAQIKNAKVSFERIEALYKEGAVAESQYDQAKLASSDESLEAAKKGLEQARVAYENAASAAKNAQVKAPIAGVVSDINIVEGQFATSSQPPMTIVDSDNITIKFGVPGNLVNKVKQGDSVLVEISSADYKDEALVNSISTSSDPMTNLYTINIVLKNNGTIKPGMFAKVYLNTDTIENAIGVKTEAVMERDNKKYVFVAENNKAIKKEVATGLDTGSYIHIKEGLSSGENVIVKGQEYINDGSTIKIVRGE